MRHNATNNPDSSQSSHGLQEPVSGLGSQSDPLTDSFEEDDNAQEDEVIQVEIGVVDPTLATLGEEDVLLDMDDTFVYQDNDMSDTSTSSEGSMERHDGG